MHAEKHSKAYSKASKTGLIRNVMLRLVMSAQISEDSEGSESTGGLNLVSQPSKVLSSRSNRWTACKVLKASHNYFAATATLEISISVFLSRNTCESNLVGTKESTHYEANFCLHLNTELRYSEYFLSGCLLTKTPHSKWQE